MKHLTLILFVLIVSISFFLNFYRLGEVPGGFHRDEAYLGYNAYSILKTGKDMSGNFIPSHLESFLYTPAGYAYLTLLSMLIFGLSEFSVRLPSAFFAVSTVIALFYLTRALLSFVKSSFSVSQVRYISLLTAFFYAVTPWGILLGRTASVITVVVFLIVCGMYFYLSWLTSKKMRFLLGSVILFSLSLSIYIAPYLFLLLFLPFTIFLFRDVHTKKESFFNIFLYMILIFIPFLFTFASPTLSLRARSLSIVNSPYVPLVIAEEIREDGVSKSPLFETRIFHNKIIGYSQYVLDNYFKHLSYSFFFTDQGYPDRYRVPLHGLLFLVQLPFLVFGLYVLIRKSKRIAFLLIGWILLSPIGSAFAADDVPNLQRTLFMLPPLSIFTAAGYIFFIEQLKQKYVVRLVIFFSSIAMMFSITFYLHQYYVHGERYRPWYRMDSYRELVSEVNQYSVGFKSVVVTNRESAPTIFFLFYNHFDPKAFQAQTNHSTFRDFDRIGFSKFIFTEEECPYKVRKERKEKISTIVLYVNSGLCKIPEDSFVHKTIRRSDNSVAFYIISRK